MIDETFLNACIISASENSYIFHYKKGALMREKVQVEVTAAPATLSLHDLVLHVVLPVLIVFSVLPVLVSLVGYSPK